VPPTSHVRSSTRPTPARLADVSECFPSEAVFAQFYGPLLQQLESKQIHDLAISIRAEFLRLAAAGAATPPDPTPHYGELQRRSPSSCLACLANVPSNALTCGHRLCDVCILRQPRPDLLRKCPFCAQANDVSFHPKPTAAGVRVLRLGGGLKDARETGLILKELRYYVCGPLRCHFDLVLCSGIGIFFGVMMFCQGASVEDCIHHLGKIEHVKARRDGFSFGSQLKFSFSELLRSQVKLVLCFKERVVSSYM
jgi:hypothetical protein